LRPQKQALSDIIIMFRNLVGNAAQSTARDVAGEAAQAAAVRASKEAAEKAAKEVAASAAQQTAKEAAEKAAKESVERVTREAAEKAAKESAEKAAKESAEKAAKEAAEKAAKETTEKAAKEAAEKAGKQTAQEVAGKAAAAAAVVGVGGYLAGTALTEYNRKNSTEYGIISIEDATSTLSSLFGGIPLARITFQPAEKLSTNDRLEFKDTNCEPPLQPGYQYTIVDIPGGSGKQVNEVVVRLPGTDKRITKEGSESGKMMIKTTYESQLSQTVSGTTQAVTGTVVGSVGGAITGTVSGAFGGVAQAFGINTSSLLLILVAIFIGVPLIIWLVRRTFTRAFVGGGRGRTLPGTATSARCAPRGGSRQMPTAAARARPAVAAAALPRMHSVMAFGACAKRSRDAGWPILGPARSVRSRR
jgi:hypothetical protein